MNYGAADTEPRLPGINDADTRSGKQIPIPASPEIHPCLAWTASPSANSDGKQSAETSAPAAKNIADPADPHRMAGMEPVPPPLPERPTVKAILAGDLPAPGRGSGTGEKQIADLLAPLTGLSGGALLLSMKAGEALGTHFHLKTGARVEHRFPYAYEIIVRALALALGSLKYEITAVFDTPSGAVFESKMNASFFSLGGGMLFQIHEINPMLSNVTGQSEIKGAMFHAGKTQRVLTEVFDKMTQFLGLLAP